MCTVRLYAATLVLTATLQGLRFIYRYPFPILPTVGTLVVAHVSVLIQTALVGPHTVCFTAAILPWLGEDVLVEGVSL